MKELRRKKKYSVIIGKITVSSNDIIISNNAYKLGEYYLQDYKFMLNFRFIFYFW